MTANWLKPNSTSTNPLQNQIQQLLNKNEEFLLTVDKDSIRQIIGEAFVQEPTFQWSISHFDFEKVLKTREELVQFSRFINSFSLMKDLDAPLHFQLCEIETTETGMEPDQPQNHNNDATTIVSCLSIHASHPSPRSERFQWFHRLKSNYTMLIYAIKILYGFGDSLPQAITSPYMKRMESKVQPWIDNVDKWHEEYGPSRPHWVLSLVGVNPKYEGNGKGTRIMKKLCDLADILDQDIYLEAGGSLKRYYEKFGFVVKGVERLVDPEDSESSIYVHLMVREAKHAIPSNEKCIE